MKYPTNFLHNILKYLSEATGLYTNLSVDKSKGDKCDIHFTKKSTGDSMTITIDKVQMCKRYTAFMIVNNKCTSVVNPEKDHYISLFI